MSGLQIDVVVFDVLGTLVDEPAGLRAGLRTARPDADDEELLAQWVEHVAAMQRDIVAGARPYVGTDVLNREAAQVVGDGDAAQTLVEAADRLPPWSDSVTGLERLAAHFPLIGLSNASPADLLRINAHAGLRWHLALSAHAARTYKPAPAVYRLAVDAAGVEPQRMLMVAAHAWDLRGAREVGLRTAYVHRPVGDPPAAGERFDLHAESLDELADQLGA